MKFVGIWHWGSFEYYHTALRKKTQQVHFEGNRCHFKSEMISYNMFNPASQMNEWPIWCRVKLGFFKSQ